MPGDLAIRAVGPDQDLRVIAPPVGRHLHAILYVTERPRRLRFMNVRTNPSGLLNKMMVEPIAHNHIGDRTGRFDQERVLSSVRKLNAENGMFDDGLEFRIEKLFNPDR